MSIRDELNSRFANYELEQEYAQYIMQNGDMSSFPICNGDILTEAMEAGYLADEFLDHLEAQFCEG